jgi:hypothetical protein
MNTKNNEGEQDFEGLQKHLVHLKNKLKKKDGELTSQQCAHK